MNQYPNIAKISPDSAGSNKKNPTKIESRLEAMKSNQMKDFVFMIRWGSLESKRGI
jgi:hypothetical protein